MLFVVVYYYCLFLFTSIVLFLFTVVVYVYKCCLLLFTIIVYYCLFLFTSIVLFLFTVVVVVVVYQCCLLSPCSSLAPISEVTRLVLLLVVDQLFRPHLYSEGRPHPLHVQYTRIYKPKVGALKAR